MVSKRVVVKHSEGSCCHGPRVVCAVRAVRSSPGMRLASGSHPELPCAATLPCHLLWTPGSAGGAGTWWVVAHFQSDGQG
eukprot:932484-Rhodomonas_salina.2